MKILYKTKKYPEPRELVDIVIDPRYNDIVLNGYGISRTEATKLYKWLGNALERTKRRHEYKTKV